jgi:heme-degrading monooxygenase HmoA
MIARTWRCRTDTRRSDALLAHLWRTGIAEACDMPGYRGHLLTQSIDPRDGVEFTLTTFWVDMPAVIQFSGPAADVARLYPEDEEYMTAADQHVTHAKVVDHRS